MSNEWTEFVNSHIDVGGEGGFLATPALLANNAACTQLIDLSQLAIIDVHGEDAKNFLQGQFCNDLGDVSSTRAQITGYCTPKGRLLAIATIVGTITGYRLVIPGAVKEQFLKRLRMFVLRAKVSIEENDADLCTGIVVDRTQPNFSFSEHLGSLPEALLDAATTASMQVIRWHDDHYEGSLARYLVVGPASIHKSLWLSEKTSVKLPEGRWRLGDVLAGVPSVREGAVEQFVPQMVNMQLIDALSFTKGCYPGQEIVARMQYLGKLKRHMRLFSSLSISDLSPEQLLPGSKLATQDDADAGIIVDAVAVADGKAYVLAVVKVSANDNMMKLGGIDLQPLDLPYSLPSLAQAESA